MAGPRVAQSAVPAAPPPEGGWRHARLAPSLAEVYRTVPVTGRGWWGRALAFAGPGYLVAVGYMDPGNWATDLAGGSQFGYALLSVILISNLMAILLQGLAAKLGIATGRDLAHARRDPAQPGPAVHRHRHPRRDGNAAQPVPPFLDRADAAVRGDDRGPAGGGALRVHRLDHRPQLRAVHQRRHPRRRRGDLPHVGSCRGGGDPGRLPAADAAAGCGGGERGVRVRLARVGPELDADGNAGRADRDGGLPQHPDPAVAAAPDPAAHRHCAGRADRHLL